MIRIDDSFEVTNSYTRGRKEKIWFKKDDSKYLYKFGASNYEIYAELIAEQLGKQVGISMAKYLHAKYKDTEGVLTKDFKKQGELIISSDRLKTSIQSIYEENNLPGDLKENTISNLLEAAFTYDPLVNVNKLFDELVKRWMFSGLIMESDKNATNISFIKKGRRIKLSPDYDNSTMCRLNENISNLVIEITNGTNIYSITDPIKQSLKPNEDSSEYFLDSLREFSNKYGEQVEIIFDEFKNINVTKAIEKVERLNKEIIPWEVKYFVEKAINTRYKDMETIIKKSKKK